MESEPVKINNKINSIINQFDIVVTDLKTSKYEHGDLVSWVCSVCKGLLQNTQFCSIEESSKKDLFAVLS